MMNPPIFPNQLEINGYTLILTCWACPEQYDVYKGHAKVGYLRLRHGSFRADYPDCNGITVYSAEPQGDGQFYSEERMKYLTEAIDAIDKQWTVDQIELTKGCGC